MVNPGNLRRLSPKHVVVVVAAMWLGQFAVEPAFAAEAPAGDTAEAAEPSERPSPGQSSATDLQKKNQALSFAFVMLGCIIVGGAMLLALVVIWGNRTRRLAQSPLPPIAKRDELWFLKPRKEAGDGIGNDVSSDPDQASDGEKS
jgi:hypothetical protein